MIKVTAIKDFQWMIEGTCFVCKQSFSGNVYAFGEAEVVRSCGLCLQCMSASMQLGNDEIDLEIIKIVDKAFPKKEHLDEFAALRLRKDVANYLAWIGKANIGVVESHEDEQNKFLDWLRNYTVNYDFYRRVKCPPDLRNRHLIGMGISMEVLSSEDVAPDNDPPLIVAQVRVWWGDATEDLQLQDTMGGERDAGDAAVRILAALMKGKRLMAICMVPEVIALGRAALNLI